MEKTPVVSDWLVCVPYTCLDSIIALPIMSEVVIKARDKDILEFGAVLVDVDVVSSAVPLLESVRWLMQRWRAGGREESISRVRRKNPFSYLEGRDV